MALFVKKPEVIRRKTIMETTLCHNTGGYCSTVRCHAWIETYDKPGEEKGYCQDLFPGGKV